jgi:hypothetical protein
LELCGSSTSQKPRYGVLKLTLQGVTAKDITTGQRLFDWSQRPRDQSERCDKSLDKSHGKRCPSERSLGKSKGLAELDETSRI